MLGDPSPENVDFSAQNRLILSASILFAIATISVGIRTGARIWIVRSVGPDDYLIIISYFLEAGYLFSILFGKRYGVGLRMKDWRPEWINEGLKFLLPFQTLYFATIYTAKTSILLFYLRLATANELFVRLCWATIILLTGFFIAAEVVTLTQCIPLSGLYDSRVQDARCINDTIFLTFAGVFNAITDIIILVLPMKLLWRLQQPSSILGKLGLIGTFSVGTVACLASCIRIYTVETYTKSSDPSYDSVPINMWSFIEISLGIFCACVPGMRAFFLQKQIKRRRAAPFPSSNVSSPQTPDLFLHPRQLGSMATLSETASPEPHPSHKECREWFDMSTFDDEEMSYGSPTKRNRSFNGISSLDRCLSRESTGLGQDRDFRVDSMTKVDSEDTNTSGRSEAVDKEKEFLWMGTSRTRDRVQIGKKERSHRSGD